MHLELSNLGDGAPAPVYGGGSRSYYIPGNTHAFCADGYTAVPDYGGGGTQCVLTSIAPAQAPAPVPAPAPAPVITVSPQIQTQVSPQISPVFQQAFQPSGSPMTAGTTQTMPTSQAGAAPAPTGPDYAALMASQQKMYETLLTKVMQPVAQQPAPYISSSPPVTAPIPPQPAQALVSFPPPDLTPPSAPAEITAAPAQIPLQKTNFMPIILTVGVVGLLIIANQKKGRRHAT